MTQTRSCTSAFKRRTRDLRLSYPGHEIDLEEAKTVWTEWPSLFDSKIGSLRIKQSLHDGDRSHPQLIALDGMDCTYPGWEEDVAAAEEAIIECSMYAPDKMTAIKRRQRLFEGNRSHPQLVALDALKLTYDGWRVDVADAEKHHVEWPSLFKSKLDGMKVKQRLHDGDRSSDPQLRILDSIKCTFPGWERQKAAAEKAHMEGSSYAKEQIAAVEKAQRLFEGDRSHPNMVALDSETFTYHGWRGDVEEAEKNHVNWPGLFKSKLSGMKIKQQIHEGDRSHPRIVALDSLKLSYPGWGQDLREAERYICEGSFYSEEKLKSLAKKQILFEESSQQRSASSPTSANAPTPVAKSRSRASLVSSVFKAMTTGKGRDDGNGKGRDDDDARNTACVICWDSERSHVYVPCGHLCVCGTCAKSRPVLKKLRCPICREKASLVMKVFT